MSFYLLEIGTEELPAAFVPLTANFMEEQAKKQLDTLHLQYKQIKTGGTPRRIYLYIDGLPAKQADRQEIVQGPPAKIAFTSDGSVSEVGMKFATSKGLDISSLTKVSSEKGNYLSGTKSIVGKETSALLTDTITQIISSIPFPKSMKWGDKDVRFARPLKYLLSLWDGKILPLNIAEFPAVDTTVGHRFLAPQAVKVTDFASYLSAMDHGFVVVDIEDRKTAILKQMEQFSQEHGYEVDKDDALLQTVANLVEYPFAVEGSFDEEFLQIPAPVLITSMKHHQKYFPTYKNGKLQSKFIGISNMKPQNSLIQAGYERVLRARLNDAFFFFNNDKKVSLETRVEALKKVTYQEKLGTSYEKMERFRTLAVSLAKHVAGGDIDVIKETATLAKADLMSEMVYEFPELQGYMGKVYARLQGKDEQIATGIEEHYMPRFADDDLPKTIAGKVVAISDKLDTIAGAFAINMIPTGNVDPYGLRRNAIGIINIIEDAGWHIAFKPLINEALELVKHKATENITSSVDKVLNYFIQRHKQMLISHGDVDADAYDAAVVSFNDFISQKAKAQALTLAKKSAGFNIIAQSFKRINNILKKTEHTSSKIDQSLFEHDEEKQLYTALNKYQSEIEKYTKAGEWSKVTQVLENFAQPLSNFFDKVMVMAENADVRKNRLSLLVALRQLFIVVGDLGEII